jgi:hypothetical protein
MLLAGTGVMAKSLKTSQRPISTFIFVFCAALGVVGWLGLEFLVLVRGVQLRSFLFPQFESGIARSTDWYVSSFGRWLGRMPLPVEGIGGVRSFLWSSGERYEMEMEMEI